MGQIEDNVRAALAAAGPRAPKVVTRLAPAWTTDWITADGRGEAARLRHRAARTLRRRRKVVRFARPAAGAARRSPLPALRLPRHHRDLAFGSTACKALYRCLALPRTVRLLQAVLAAMAVQFHPLARQARPPRRRRLRRLHLAVPAAAARRVRFPAGPVPDAARDDRRRGDAAQLFDLQPVPALPATGEIDVGIKPVDDGSFSRWAMAQLQAGQRDRRDAAGRPLHAARSRARGTRRLRRRLRHHADAVAHRDHAGGEPDTSFTLVYGNRASTPSCSPRRCRT